MQDDMETMRCRIIWSRLQVFKCRCHQEMLSIQHLPSRFHCPSHSFNLFSSIPALDIQVNVQKANQLVLLVHPTSVISTTN